MTIPIEQRGLDLESLLVQPENGESPLSLPLRFGLGAGLYFEYFRRPQQAPSRQISGLNRDLNAGLRARIPQYLFDDPRRAVLEVLRENALLFNLDRAPTAALMGMELLAEELPNFAGTPDWIASVSTMSSEITSTGSLHRRLYLDFLAEIQPQISSQFLCDELAEIVQEWDELAGHMAGLPGASSQPEGTSRLLRRLAFREEHFWGTVLEFCDQSLPPVSM